jgi:dCTP deaminase
MMSDKEILEAMKSGRITIKNFDASLLHPASYDARVGEVVFKTRPEKGLVNVREKGLITIEPGEFAILTTFEHFELSVDVAGHIGLRSYFARKGLVLLSGPQINPGFRGLLVLGCTISDRRMYV